MLIHRVQPANFDQLLQGQKKQSKHAVQKAFNFYNCIHSLIQCRNSAEIVGSTCSGIRKGVMVEEETFSVRSTQEHRCCNSSICYLNKAETRILAYILGSAHVAHRRFSCCRRDFLSLLKAETHAAISLHAQFTMLCTEAIHPGKPTT